MIMRAGRGRKATVRRKARRRRSKKTEEGDKHLRWGRRRNSLTDNFTLAVYMRFLVAADIDGRVVNSRLPLGVVRHGQTLPLHPGVEHPQDEVKNAVIAQFALWPALGHREVRQDKCRELGFRELDRNRRSYRLLGCCAHHAMASWEEG